MNKAQEYINSKTNSILKTNISKNYRDVITTIVYNELSDLLHYVLNQDVDSSVYADSLARLLYNVLHHLYSDVPIKLEPYCSSCNSCCNNGCGLQDCFLLGLLYEDESSFLLEDDSIILLERLRVTPCSGGLEPKIIIPEPEPPIDPGDCISTIMWEGELGSIIWETDLPALLELLTLCEEETDGGPIKWENDTSISLELGDLDLMLEGVYYTDETERYAVCTYCNDGKTNCSLCNINRYNN